LLSKKGDRYNQVVRFQTDPSCKLIFISLMAGSEGITLTAASNVIICDPWWNPQVREMFIVHVGCTRCVTSSIDRMVQIHARITWGVEFIRAIFFIFFFDF
jgi:hypothetical protein